KSVDKNMIIKSFEICGVLGENLEINKLHKPLNSLLVGKEFDESFLYNLDGSYLAEEELNEDINDWLFIGKDSCTFFKIISLILYDRIDLHKDVRKNIADKIKTIPYLKNLYDNEYIEEIKKPSVSASELEIFAASRIYNITINLYLLRILNLKDLVMKV
ncbi:MAG: hypothetical protein ACRCZ9_10680, partial [Fusobacteriaceae bacterium]